MCEDVLLLIFYAGVARSCSASSYRFGTIHPALITVIMQCNSSLERLGVGTRIPIPARRSVQFFTTT